MGSASSMRQEGSLSRAAAILIWAFCGCAVLPARGAAAQAAIPEFPQATMANPELRRGREPLQPTPFRDAKGLFSGYLRTHPADVQAKLGLGDAELGLREFEAAELTYRAVVAQQPELWQAHKNLVVVEAELGRWEEFDGERRILELARERGAPGISARESDVIDAFDVAGARWVVRAYFEPLGRSKALYNFERFSAAGRVEEYVSLEDAAAAAAALTPGDVRIGAEETGAPAAVSTYALNWYSGRAHGTVTTYGQQPGYERVRSDLRRWLRGRAAGSSGR